MEQKYAHLEIILQLLKKRNHIRGMAKLLKTNHMIILRKMNYLTEQNVLDFNYEGKNKSYFLKKTVETRAYIYIAERYKLIKTINKYPELRKTIEDIQNDKRIKMAILFGSYSKELAKSKSDVDIFIETNDQTIKKEYELKDSKLSIKIGRYNKNNNLIKEIKKNHVIIKGVEEYYQKTEFFEDTS